MATKSKNEETKAVAKNPTAGVLTERPDFLQKGGTAGRENITAEDILLPRLEIVQALSPAVDENKAEYILGARVGDLVNSVTREIYEKPVMFVPVQFVKQYNLWKLRKHGGGFMGTYPTLAAAEAELTTRVPSNEHEQYEILDTPVFYGLLPRFDGEVLADMQRISVSMPRTKAKHARRLNSLIDMTHEDAYNRVYAIGTVNDKNKQGQDFKNFTIDQLGYPSEVMVEAAKAFYKQVGSGVVKVHQTPGSSDAPDSTEY